MALRWPQQLTRENGVFRLGYRPPTGFPAPNVLIPSNISEIEFQGLPGTKYDFQLYYSNLSISDKLTWATSLTMPGQAPKNIHRGEDSSDSNSVSISVPEVISAGQPPLPPPESLTVDILSGSEVLVSWRPPSLADHSGFKLRLAPLSDTGESVRSLGLRNSSLRLGDLKPGATYQIQISTVLGDMESQAAVAANFTTRPNPVGRFIVWFRNSTTLNMLWQPPHPAGFYTDYAVSLQPQDADLSELLVPREGSPPGPSKAEFPGLVPALQHQRGHS